MEVKDSQIIKVLIESLVEQGTKTPPTGGTTPQNLPDVNRLNTTIEKSPSIKTAVKYINTRPELVKAIASIMTLLGKELQPGRISAGTVTTDLRAALKAAGYK